jgi:8-oxo-dGTP diphosphatase
MQMQRAAFPIAAHVFLIHAGSVLLLKRAGTGFEDQNYGVPAGHLELGESIKQAAIRECQEEIGVELDPAALEVIGVEHYHIPTGEGVDFFLTASRWTGEPYPRAECDEVRWCPLDALPSNTIPFIARALQHHLQSGHWFDELGWADT